MSASVDFGLGLPSFKDLGKMALRWGRMAVWAEDPVMQIVVNLVIVVTMMLSSAVGFVVGIPIALLALSLAGVGALRLILGVVM